MKEWLFLQFEHFNVFMILAMIIFVTALSKANTQKQLKEQSQEFYKELEEVKDEIRGQHSSLAALIQTATKGK